MDCPFRMNFQVPQFIVKKIFFHLIWHLTYINEWKHAKFQFWAPKIIFCLKNSIFSPKNQFWGQYIWCLKIIWYLTISTLCIETSWNSLVRNSGFNLNLKFYCCCCCCYCHYYCNCYCYCLIASQLMLSCCLVAAKLLLSYCLAAAK